MNKKKKNEPLTPRLKVIKQLKGRGRGRVRGKKYKLNELN